MPGIPLLTKFSDVVGAVSPVASEVISLLLVKILHLQETNPKTITIWGNLVFMICWTSHRLLTSLPLFRVLCNWSLQKFFSSEKRQIISGSTEAFLFLSSNSLWLWVSEFVPNASCTSSCEGPHSGPASWWRLHDPSLSL